MGRDDPRAHGGGLPIARLLTLTRALEVTGTSSLGGFLTTLGACHIFPHSPEVGNLM